MRYVVCFQLIIDYSLDCSVTSRPFSRTGRRAGLLLGVCDVLSRLSKMEQRPVVRHGYYYLERHQAVVAAFCVEQHHKGELNEGIARYSCNRVRFTFWRLYR